MRKEPVAEVCVSLSARLKKHDTHGIVTNADRECCGYAFVPAALGNYSVEPSGKRVDALFYSLVPADLADSE